MRRALPGGYDLDDDVGRVDVDAVHHFLAHASYCARGRPRELQRRLVEEADRVVGLYHHGRQVGFCRAVSDGTAFAYLADVYVLAEHRGRGLGEALARAMVEEGPFAGVKWLLHTEDMHALYRKVGFGEPGRQVMERLPAR